MKKLFFGFALVFGSFSLYSCDSNTGVSNNEEDGTVIQSDTTVSELEVERTVRDIDTSVTTETETIDPNTNNQ